MTLLSWAAGCGSSARRVGVTLAQAAQTLECSPSKLSRIERGQTLANPRDVRDLAPLYRVPAGQRNRLLATARTAWTIRRRHRPTRPDRGGVR
jgi:transcriptional regulator with XRE-family HTH domain